MHRRALLHRFTEVIEEAGDAHQVVEGSCAHIALSYTSTDAKGLLQEETGLDTLIRMIAARLAVERFCLTNE